MRSLAALFGQSPFGPLQAHMKQAVACSALVPGLFDALLAGDSAALAEAAAAIGAAESAADTIKNDLRDHLPKRIFLPVDRRDILEILDLQDTIADAAEDVADLLQMRSWVVPESMKAPLLSLVSEAVACAVAGGQVMEELDDLVSAAFAGPEQGTIRALIEEVLRLEQSADDVESVLLKLVFTEEEALGPVGVVLWLQLIERLGDIADYSKKACNRLRLLVAT